MPKHRREIQVPDGYRLIFRFYKKNPKTGELMPPPPGCKAWPILVPIGEPANDNE
jgi:hypothetical protein